MLYSPNTLSYAYCFEVWNHIKVYAADLSRNRKLCPQRVSETLEVQAQTEELILSSNKLVVINNAAFQTLKVLRD